MTTGGNGIDAQVAAAAGNAVPMSVALALVRLARQLKIPLSHEAPQPSAIIVREPPAPKPASDVAPGLPSVARAALGPAPRPMVTQYYAKEALKSYLNAMIA